MRWSVTKVLGLEVDESLAARARMAVPHDSPVDIRHGNGRGPFDRAFDAICVNAGVTHPLTPWLIPQASFLHADEWCLRRS